MNSRPGAVETLDAVVVGAGLAGLYQLHRLVQLGLNVRAFEAAEGVGGVWHWNRYPGARVDSHLPFYQYWFSKDLWDEADWTERFPAQPEIERYLNRVCDKFGLRRHITFGTRVTSAHYDETTAQWTIATDRGERVSARFLVFNTGGLSEPSVPPFAGHDTFSGVSCHTSHWPKEGVELEGKRVAVIGTGATGIQVIQTIAAEVAQLTVFQRTPNYAVAMRNPAVTPDDLTAMREGYEALKAQTHASFGGFVYDGDPPAFEDVPAYQREKHLDSVWQDGSLKMWGGAFADAFVNPDAAAAVSRYVGKRIRDRVADPKVAEKLIPSTYHFGTRRVPLENGYYEAFNRPNVTLVDLNETPVTHIDARGMQTSEAHYDLDVIIYATGFDAGVGALNKIDIRGRGGLSLKAKWDEELATTMGLQVHGFPNMFTTMAPFAPASALCNIPTCVDQQVDWITTTIDFVRRSGARSIEPSAETEEAWMAHHREVSEPTLIGQTNRSWYRRTRPDGRPGELIAYMGGVAHYREHCDAVRASGYKAFIVSRAASPTAAAE
jgi:acetone monooxygenase (methyl acetate-forming)